jgi:hypothetical protein
MRNSVGALGAALLVVAACGSRGHQDSTRYYFEMYGRGEVVRADAFVPPGGYGERQTAPAGTTLPLPLTVVVYRFERTYRVLPAEGYTVTFRVLSGGASLSTTPGVTEATAIVDANGAASVTCTLGGTPGTAVIEASFDYKNATHIFTETGS